MKPSKKNFACHVTLIIAAIIGLASCNSTGTDRSKQASATMETVENDIKSVGVQLDVTGASLDELMKQGQPEVKKAFDAFTDNLSKLESMQKKVARHADEMKERGKEYFEEWQKEGDKYKNQQIQELSEQRRADLGAIYSRIAENSIGVRDAFKAYLSDAKEIQNYLSNDLTSKGIEAIAPTSKRVVSNGENLRLATKNVQTAIERARAEMAQSGR
jgi:hypothetical protein